MAAATSAARPSSRSTRPTSNFIVTAKSSSARAFLASASPSSRVSLAGMIRRDTKASEVSRSKMGAKRVGFAAAMKCTSISPIAFAAPASGIDRSAPSLVSKQCRSWVRSASRAKKSSRPIAMQIHA
eukprot:scaffold213_cov245-Pinguiococcus_pyrenoidosus.AAC.32